MKSGNCRLCGSYGALHSSHSIPAWVFRRLGPDPQLVVVSKGVVRATNDQLREHLFCATCERTFKRPEDHVAGLAWQSDGSFPALDRAEIVPLPGESSDARMARLPLADRNLVVRFAVSLFWRASVCSKIDFSLAERDEAWARDFLNGAADLPAEVRLAVVLLRRQGELPADQVLGAPSTSRVDAYSRLHKVTLPGIHFMMAIGSRFPCGVDTLCFARTGLAMIASAERFAEIIAMSLARAEPVGAFARRTSAASRARMA
jgi:hypothetical protein